MRFERFLKTATACGVVIVALTVSASAADKLKYAIMPAGMDTYGQAVIRGFSDEAKKAGVEPVVVDSQWSVEKMANNIEDLIVQKVDAVAMAPIDSVVAQSWVDNLVEKGIVVASTGSNVGDPKEHGPKWVYPGLAAVVAADLVEAGRVAGKLALPLFPKDRPANIAIVQGAPGFAVNDQHYQGIKEALAEAGVKYNIVADQPTDWSPQSGESVCQNMLTSNPDIDVIFSFADPMSVGCARSVTAMKSNAKIISVTGGMQIGKDEVAHGTVYGGVCIRPELMGRKLFDAVNEAVKSGSKKAGKYIGYDLIAYTKKNLDDCPAEW